MKLSMNKLRLKWKIFAFLIGFCALLLLILWFFQIVFLDSFYQGIKVMEIKSNANIIAQNIDNNNISGLITSISENGESYIEICSLDGNVITSSSNTKYKISLVDKLKMISKAEKDKNEYYEKVSVEPPQTPAVNDNYIGDLPPSNSQPGEALAYFKIVKNSKGETLTVIINSIISPVNATVNTLRYQLIFVSGIMIILSIILALLIAKRISKPIEEINKSAKVLANGDYKICFNATGFLEIQELSNTLNTTATELNKTEDLRHELMANVSHDLRTPLSLIYSYAEMIHDFPGEVTPEQTQIIMDETQRLTTLVNDMLDISKLEAGVQDLKLSDYNLTMSIKATTERIGELVKNDGYKLTFNYDEEVILNADEVKITQGYYNLLLNAIHYTGTDRTVNIRQSVSTGTVKVEVSDTGEGITPENMKYIWDRYYKVDKKHKRAIMGTGLGLSIVKKVIELHGGRYGVYSKIGEGSTFWFELKLKN